MTRFLVRLWEVGGDGCDLWRAIGPHLAVESAAWRCVVYADRLEDAIPRLREALSWSVAGRPRRARARVEACPPDLADDAADVLVDKRGQAFIRQAAVDRTLAGPAYGAPPVSGHGRERLCRGRDPAADEW